MLPQQVAKIQSDLVFFLRLVAATKFCGDKILLWTQRFSQKFSTTHEAICRCDMSPQRVAATSRPTCTQGVIRHRRLFPFRKQSLPFLTVDVTITNQAFSHDRYNIFPGLSYKKAKNTFSNSVRKNDVGAQVEFSLSFTKRARVTLPCEQRPFDLPR